MTLAFVVGSWEWGVGSGESVGAPLVTSASVARKCENRRLPLSYPRCKSIATRLVSPAAIDSDGRIFVALENGHLLCFGS